jgi:hypothetical protein
MLPFLVDDHIERGSGEKMKIDIVVLICVMCTMSLAALLAAIVRWWTGSTIIYGTIRDEVGRRPIRFTTKYLLIATTATGFFLAVVANSVFSMPSGGFLFSAGLVIWMIVMGFTWSFVACVPTLLVPWGILAGRPSWRGVGWGLAFWATWTVAAALVFIVVMAPDEVRGSDVLDVFTVQCGAALVGVLAGVILRLGGYRLAKRPRRSALLAD